MCVCAYVCVRLNDGAALTETAANRRGCSLAGAPDAVARRRQPSCPLQAAGSQRLDAMFLFVDMFIAGVEECVRVCARAACVWVFVLDV